MEIYEVLSILHRLVDGIDPMTGEIFPPDSPYQTPDIIRALFTAVNTLEKIQEKTKKRKNLPTNAGKPWTEEEQKSLIDRFGKGITINELSKEHERTPGAITSRLVKLGIIQLPST